MLEEEEEEKRKHRSALRALKNQEIEKKKIKKFEKKNPYDFLIVRKCCKPV